MKAKDAVSLMRSRYSAYALNLYEYIIHTTHTKSPHYEKDLLQWKESIADFSRRTTFVGLSILEHSKDMVTFHAKLLQNGKDASFTEKSFFENENGTLKYFQGSRV
ncbi:hypothetical protein K0U07_05445 [bacterium]|nr:hypothetical protein [bacterium]